MTKRAGFGPSKTCSKGLRIEVDKWAGSYEGQQHKKLQLDIDRYLDQLTEALESADDITQRLIRYIDRALTWNDSETKRLHDAHGNLTRSEQIIDDLDQRSQGSPYEFVALQMKNIDLEHIVPAREHLVATEKEERLFSGRKAKLGQASFHIQQALNRLKALRREYEVAKREADQAQRLMRVSEMHQIFVEDMYNFLGSLKEFVGKRG